MTVKAFRVDTNTLALIDSYLEKNPDGQKKIAETLAASIAKLNEQETSTYQMLKEQPSTALVTAKKPYKKLVKAKHGQKGPYRVTKKIESFTGRDSFYQIEGSDNLFPSDWFQEEPPKKDSQLALATALVLWSVFLFSGGYALGIFQYVFLTMMLL